MTILRDYQRQALAAFREALSPEVNRVAIEMATGLGKTVTGAHAAVEFLDSLEGARKRVLILVPTDEITRQWVEKLEFTVSQGEHPYTVGVVKATRDETDADLVVASVATLIQPGRREQITDVGFIIVDEAHHGITPSTMAILKHFRGIWTGECPDPECYGGCRAEDTVPVLGLSATLARGDGQGLGQVWQAMPFSRSIRWAQRKGWLIPLEPYTIKIPDVDTSTDATLDATLAGGIAPEAVVQAWTDKNTDYLMDPFHEGRVAFTHLRRPSTVLFAPLVASAQAFADAFNAAGIKAEVIHGKMAPAARQAVLDRYEAGVTTVLCNAMALTEGWDSPRTMCVIVARPSRGSLFVQMVGRGVRPWLSAGAPPRAEQRCVLLVLQGGATELEVTADLSEDLTDTLTGQATAAMDDQWDLGADLEPEVELWRGPVRVEAWDAMVQRSSKAWKFTEGGVPFLPTAKRGQGYVFVVEVTDQWQVWYRTPVIGHTARMRARKQATAPDLELAMALAEDIAQDLGGDIGALLADKTRAWRKAVPSEAQQDQARRLGLGRELDRILAQRASGKAGKLSDLMDKVTASRVLDPVAQKIRERGQAT
jgi:superfamily II DNA or RNA helicase